MSENAVHLSLSQALRSLVSSKFHLARASQSLIFSETHLSIIHSRAGIPFQLRYCPALSKKPTQNHQSSSSSQLPNQDSSAPVKKFDPFEDPSSDLLVARVPDPQDHTHNLVLNKYPVIVNHFILATRANKPQTDVLEEVDLAFGLACIRAWQNAGAHSLYAFFNSGPFSGASQPHRHLQFLPIEAMYESSSSSSPSSTPLSSAERDVLCSRMTTPIYPECSLLHDPELPIAHFATTISVSTSPSELHEKYLLLLRAASVLITSHGVPSFQRSELLSPTNLASATIATESGQTTLSYNLAITEDKMAILPRRAEDAVIPGLSNKDNRTGVVSINGTILAGTLMVKNEDEWETLKSQTGLMDVILKQIGFPQIETPKI